MNVVIKVNDEVKQKMIQYYKDKMRDKKIPYVVFQAKDEDTVITMYESGKVMFQGTSADVDAAMWGTFLSNTFEVNIDSHHRILLPKNLMVKVGIKRQVIVVGMFDRLEIWDYDRFQEESLEEEKSFADDSMKLVQNEK